MDNKNWDISKTIIAKSDQMNAQDLLFNTIFKVLDVNIVNDPNQPVHITLDGFKVPYKPCKSMRKVLGSLWGVDSQKWLGRSIELYNDLSAKWKGEEVGGVRISAMSDIGGQKKVITRESRHKIKTWIIENIIIASFSDILESIKKITPTSNDLRRDTVDKIMLLDGEYKEKAGKAYKARIAELKQGEAEIKEAEEQGGN